MDESIVLLALFREVTPVADVLERLRQLGVHDRDMTVLSRVPYPARVLGRPMVWERLPLISLSGALVGLGIGLFLNVGTPLLYPVRVGGQPLVPLPPTAVITYEFVMMGLIVSTFLGVLWESAFPSLGPKHYHHKISDGRIGILFSCRRDQSAELTEVLHQQGAEEVVEPPEHRL